MKKFFVFSLICLITYFSGCAPTHKINQSEYQIFKLSNELAQSRDKDFSVYVPSGWFSTKDINYDGNEIWLIKENYTGIIQLRKLNPITKPQIENDFEYLLEIARLNLILHKRKNETTFKLISPPKLYQNGRLIYSSFEYTFGDYLISRIILFKKNGILYECAAYTTDKKYGKISLIELFSTQESVVASFLTY
ncbi:MAG: hypothetical protein N2043_12460 [Ignavibacterium sp.]|nr:hypothetical protein [Ignavibacterium sp.]